MFFFWPRANFGAQPAAGRLAAHFSAGPAQNRPPRGFCPPHPPIFQGIFGPLLAWQCSRARGLGLVRIFGVTFFSARAIKPNSGSRRSAAGHARLFLKGFFLGILSFSCGRLFASLTFHRILHIAKFTGLNSIRYGFVRALRALKCRTKPS